MSSHAATHAEHQTSCAHIVARAAAGDFRGAIEEAGRLDTGRHDPLLERELAYWRTRAFDAAQDAAAGIAWPPDVTDPFAGRSGVIEMAATELDAKLLGGTLVHHGCLLVRGLLDAQEIASLGHDIDQAFDDRQAASQCAFESARTPWYTRVQFEEPWRVDSLMSRAFTEDGYGILTVDSPRTLGHLLAACDKHRIIDMLRDYFGERPLMSIRKSTLRKVPPTFQASGWHQDGAFLGTQIRSVNMWLALSHCGEDASGLDLLPCRLHDIIETGTGDAPFPWAASDAAVRAAAVDTGIVSPVFQPGDALFFDHMLMHRTGLPPGMCKPRRAIESWFFAPTGYPMEQIPLWV